MESEGEGPTSKILKGPVLLSDSFLLKNLCIGVGFSALTNGSGRVVDQCPATDGLNRELFECVGER